MTFSDMYFTNDFHKRDNEKSINPQRLISDVQVNQLLDIVGPEGLYEIANILTQTANKDVNDSINNTNYDY